MITTPVQGRSNREEKQCPEKCSEIKPLAEVISLSSKGVGEFEPRPVWPPHTLLGTTKKQMLFWWQELRWAVVGKHTSSWALGEKSSCLFFFFSQGCFVPGKQKGQAKENHPTQVSSLCLVFCLAFL